MFASLSNLRRAALATIAALCLVISSACAGGTSSSSGSGGSTDIKIGLTAAPANLDMTQTSGAAIPQALMYNVYESLVKLNTDGKTIEPLLAEDWSVSDDGLTYTFNLRKDVAFSNGDKFDAQTVKFNLERLNSWTANTPSNLSAIDHVDVSSDYAAKVVLNKPDRNVLYWLAGPLGAMFDPNSVNSLKTKAIGTGPFLVKSYSVGSKMLLTRNAKYWGNKPFLENVQLTYYTDTTSCSNALLSGDIDTIYDFIAYDQLDQFKNNSNYSVRVGNAQGILVLSMNSQKGPFSNEKLRKAVMYAVNRKAIVDTVLNGYGTVLSAPTIPTDAWYSNVSSMYSFNQDKAKKLIKESGIDNPTIVFKVPSRSYAQSVSQLVKTQLEAVGFTVKLETEEFPAVWLKNTFNGKQYDMTVINHVEPRSVFNYGNSEYYWNYTNTAVSSAFEQARKSSTDEAFNTAMGNAVKQIQEDAPADWIYNPKLVVVSKSDVSGINKNDVGISLELSNIKRS
ncbi:ABC transporter substrate-binding protein [Bifidobacterium thermophilum]|uniref:ABC transporter substrate-binding protein n=1 Tax=Bifidobacterium thermophilum TaxID=33905 RepID=UPI003994AA8A